MKKLLMLGLALVFMLGIGFSSIAADRSDVEKLVSLIKSGEIKLWTDTPEMKVMHVYENTGKHSNFETTFKRHFAVLEGSGVLESFTIILRDYQDYYTIHDAQGFILVILVDYNKDGVVDVWRKDYMILLDKSYFLTPFYPPGYINHDWFKMSREEAQQIYDAELKYMLENTDKANSVE
jgi:hypothetical protein